MISIDKTAKISALCDIEDSVKGSKIIIEANSVIDSFVKIKPAGGLGDLIIGEKVIINSGCVIYTGNGIIMGNNISVASNCTFAPTNHQFIDKNKLINQQGFCQSKGGIIIEDDVWIGRDVTFTPGRHVKMGSVIGACCLLCKDFPEYSIIGGNPSKLIRSRLDKE